MTVPDLPAQLARTRLFQLGEPTRFTVAPGGTLVLFVRSMGGADPVSCLWAADAPGWAERLLADPRALLAGAAEHLPAAERARRERAREISAGIVSYACDTACTLAAFALSGQLWTVPTTGGAARRLAAAGPVVDPRPDPAGRQIAYVSGGGLRVIAADGTADRAVAGPDGDDVTFGLAEHVAAESMGRHRGYWWAPDGRRLLVARADEARVERWYLSDPSDPASPPACIRYAPAGTANADVSLWIAAAGADAGEAAPRALTPVDWDPAAFEYLTAAGWDAHGPIAAVQSRDQRTAAVLGIDPDSGATSVLAEQRDDAWVRLVPGLPARTASGTLITAADSGDTRRLLAGGRPVTPPGLQVAAVLSVDGDDVLFAASDEPTQRHLWKYHDAHGLRRISDEPGVHDGTCQGGTMVLSSAGPQRLGARHLIRTGLGDAEVASHAERPVLRPVMELLRLGPRELRAALFLPSWHRPGDPPLPVLMDPYGGPAMCKVTAEHGWWTYTSQWFAEHGFAVLVADGRGTPGRGPAWERSVYLDIAGPVLDDQAAAIEHAAALRPALDPSRVGIRGWSFGGYLAALAVLRRPDVFHAGIAGAPVTDHLLYDTHWQERRLGHPREHPEAYERSSLIADAPSLRRPLLLVHGLSDDNVVAAHTLRLSAALLAAGRPHEVLPLPRTTHMPADRAVLAGLLRHELDFLRRSLRLDNAQGDHS